MLIQTIVVWLIVIIILLIVGTIGVFWFSSTRRKKRMAPNILDSVFLEILVPKEKSADDPDANKEEKDVISVVEQLFTTLAHRDDRGRLQFFQKQDSISFEIISVDKKISFFINCPKRLQDLVEKQVHAQYPDAQIEPVKPPRLTKNATDVVAYELGLQKKFVYPIKTYKQMETDPLNALTSSLSKLSEVESGAIQLILAPAPRGWRVKVNKKAREIQKGEDVTGAGDSVGIKTLRFISSGVGDILTTAASGSTKNQKNPLSPSGDLPEQKEPLTPMQQEMVKRLEEKASKSAFAANVRVLVAGQGQVETDAHMRNILSSFMQYTQEPFNGFKVAKKKQEQVVKDFIFRAPSKTKMVLNTEELASIFHLPNENTETPNIKWLSSKRAPAPTDMPAEGVLLGISQYRGIQTEVRIQEKDRQRHMYIIGRTGTGKSEFMKNMARQDIANGEGLAVVDPHGDLIEDLLQFVPKNRAEDVILFEPFDLERPMGLNMLEVKGEEQKDFAVQEMIEIFYKLFPPEMIGPMFEHNMRNVMLTLMADREEPGTIAEIPRMFTDPEFQKYKTSKVADPVVRAFWEQEMAKTSDFHKSEMLGYLISKVGRFVENEMMRNIIGQSHSAFDFREAMDQGKILLLNLSKGKTGEVNAKLLGLIIVSKLQMAAMARADMPEEERRTFYLYIDEFQNFVTDSIATILSEARKYRLALVMAHQYIAQLVNENDTKIRDAVFGNVGTMAAFRIGVEDAEVMAKEFAPVFNEFDVVNIERFNAYVKLMINSTTSRPFSMGTLPPPEGGSREIAEAVRRLSKLKYSRPRAEVSAEIQKRARLGENPVQPAGIEPTQ